MAFFQSNKCAAFSWDDQDIFRGVLLQRYGDLVQVRNFWQTEKVRNRSRAQIMEQGIPALGVDEETTVIVGGNYTKTCFIDLKMPKLPASDLKNAIAFELSKYSPVPVEEIQWGYRVIGKIEGTESNLVRVVYFPEDEWESWVAAASGISDGVDMIIPPIAVLDPEMDGIDVCLGNKQNGNEVYLFKSTHEGERSIICLPPEEPLDKIFGGGQAPLEKDGFDPGELNQLQPDQQSSFAPSIVLGMYGLSKTFYSDRKYWLPVPLEMRPRRNRSHKIFTLAVIIYLVLLLSLLFTSTFYRKHKELQALTAESNRLEADREQYEFTDTPETKIEELETQVMEINQSLFSMAAILREFTTLSNEKLWCTNFSWDSGDVRAELRADSDDPDLTLALQNSKLITDVTMNKRQIRDGAVNYTINCRAKTPDEAAEDEETAPEEVDRELDTDDEDLDRNDEESEEDEEDEEDEEFDEELIDATLDLDENGLD